MRRRRKAVDAEHAYYYNTETGEVEHGMISSFTNRLGPYPTREAALHAKEIARERNHEWDLENKEWDDDPDWDLDPGSDED